MSRKHCKHRKHNAGYFESCSTSDYPPSLPENSSRERARVKRGRRLYMKGPSLKERALIRLYPHDPLPLHTKVQVAIRTLTHVPDAPHAFEHWLGTDHGVALKAQQYAIAEFQ